jgi:hypothetical protein
MNERIDMSKQIMAPALVIGLMASFSLVRAGQPAQLARPCLHGRQEQPSQQARREQAVKVAQQDQSIYEATPRMGARLVPVETR